MCLARLFNPEVSGRDKGEGYRYFLACAYTVPCDYRPEVPGDEAPKGVPLLESSETSEKAPAAGGIGEVEGDLFPELWNSSEDDGEGGHGAKAVRVRVRKKRPEDEDPDPLKPDDSGVEVTSAKGLKFRTLFMGTPLRTKKGKEVLSQVQCIINRLEAYGYPVNRYHSDRAKELRSAGLIGWLRTRGIHASWTPGDSPAGNRAELGVQNLKGLVRKLLGLAKLEVGYWPLALCHASERNWAMFAEALGVPQVSLLPFGVRVEARKRFFKTGFEAQWQSRTVSGIYLGVAASYSGWPFSFG